MNWTTDKPVFTEDCVLITAHSHSNNGYMYRLWSIEQRPVSADSEDFYFAWLNDLGEELGDINDLKADKYLILPKI